MRKMPPGFSPEGLFHWRGAIASDCLLLLGRLFGLGSLGFSLLLSLGFFLFLGLGGLLGLLGFGSFSLLLGFLGLGFFLFLGLGGLLGLLGFGSFDLLLGFLGLGFLLFLGLGGFLGLFSLGGFGLLGLFCLRILGFLLGCRLFRDRYGLGRRRCRRCLGGWRGRRGGLALRERNTRKGQCR